MDSKWLVSFRGRNPSLYYGQNFLWQKDNLYIMDNHRAALWCWLQKITSNQKYNLIHLDQHYDTLYTHIDEWEDAIPSNICDLDINQYLDLKFESELGPAGIFRFDNYLSLFLKHFNLINECLFVTQNMGTKPRFKNSKLINDPKEVVSAINDYLLNTKYPCIFNFDLDYFFNEKSQNNIPIFSESYIDEVLSTISDNYRSGKIFVMTLALSPEYSGGWREAERICYKFSKAAGIKFRLPR